MRERDRETERQRQTETERERTTFTSEVRSARVDSPAAGWGASASHTSNTWTQVPPNKRWFWETGRRERAAPRGSLNWVTGAQ